MAYANKTYICFDADTDIRYYRLMTAWKEHEHIAFNFHNAHELTTIRSWSSEEAIKRSLRERLQNTKVLVVLIGEKTRFLHKYVRWEIEYAIENDIPIIAVNLNGSRVKDERCPAILRDELAIYVPFGQKIIDYALNNWPAQHREHRKKNEKGAWGYRDSIYNNL